MYVYVHVHVHVHAYVYAHAYAYVRVRLRLWRRWREGREAEAHRYRRYQLAAAISAPCRAAVTRLCQTVAQGRGRGREGRRDSGGMECKASVIRPGEDDVVA